MTPVVKISANFQLSGRGDGFTLSFDIVIMVPGSSGILKEEQTRKHLFRIKTKQTQHMEPG